MDTEVQELRGILLDIRIPGKPGKCIVVDGTNPEEVFTALYQWLADNSDAYGVHFEDLQVQRSKATR